MIGAAMIVLAALTLFHATFGMPRDRTFLFSGSSVLSPEGSKILDRNENTRATQMLEMSLVSPSGPPRGIAFGRDRSAALTMRSAGFCFPVRAWLNAGAVAAALARQKKGTGMTHVFEKAALGAALVASAALATTPAEARDRHYNRGHDRTGTAIAAGVVGLAIGAAIASGSRRGSYYNDGYYDSRYRGSNYYPQQSYYNYNNYQRGYNYENYDRRYRDGYRYERKHRKWHRNHNRWDD